MQTRQSNLRFWRNRLGRYLGNNREYRKVRGVGFRGHAVKDLSNELLARWLVDPERMFRDPAVQILKDSRSSTVAILEHGGEKYIIKWFRRNSVLTGIKNLLRRSPAMRSWIFGQSLRDRGLPTARPLAVLQRFRGGFPREGFLIFKYIAGAVELPGAVARASADERKQLAEDLGRLVRDVHDKGVSHGDLKAPNILIADGRPVLVDLVGIRLGLRVPFRERVRNLARLNASFFRSPLVRNSDRLRFLRAYRSWSLAQPVGWKILWKAIVAETLVKVEKNRRSGRVLA